MDSPRIPYGLGPRPGAGHPGRVSPRAPSSGATAWLACAALTAALSGCGEGTRNGNASDAIDAATSREKAPVAGAAESVSPIYRFAKISNGAYFYTGDPAERDVILAGFPDFRYEGVAFLRNTSATAALPVFRFANLNNGGYFYTASEAERQVVLRDFPHMRFEGSSFSVTPIGTPDSAVTYRLANVNTGNYLYTSSENERQAALALGFWRDEGAVFAVPLGTGLPPNLDQAFRTPVWLAGSYNADLLVVDPDRPGDTALFQDLANGDDIVYVATHRVDAATRRSWDPHVSHVLVRRGNNFVQLDLVKGRGDLQFRQVSNEASASNECSTSSLSGDRMFVDLANPLDSTYVYGKRVTSGDCRLHQVRLSMGPGDSPLLLPSVVPISALYDAQGAISGYLAEREGEILRYDRSFANPVSIGSFGWNPSRIENLLLATAVLPASQLRGDPGFVSFNPGNRYPGTGGWIGPTGRSFVLFATYQSSSSFTPNRLFAYDDASRTMRLISQPEFRGTFDAEEWRQSIAIDDEHVYWVDGSGVWRFSLRFNGVPQQIVNDASARQPIFTTASHVVYHQAVGTNPSARIVSVAKAGGTVASLAEADTPGGRVRAVGAAGQNLFFNGSRDTGEPIFSGKVLANGAGGYDASLLSHWIGWVRPYAWGASDDQVLRMIRAQQVPGTPVGQQVSLQLTSVDAADPGSSFALTTWNRNVSSLPTLGTTGVRAYRLPVIGPRALIAGEFQNTGLLDLYLADVQTPGLFVRKSLRGSPVAQ